MRLEQRVEVLGKANIVANHLSIIVPAGMAQAHPDLQCTKAARVLHPQIEVVRGVIFEVVIRGMIGKRI